MKILEDRKITIGQNDESAELSCDRAFMDRRHNGPSDSSDHSKIAAKTVDPQNKSTGSCSRSVSCTRSVVG